MSAKSTTYTADDIKVLSSVTAIRKSPGMYVGSTDSFGLFILLKEIIENAVDECRHIRGSAEVIVYGDTKKDQYAVRDFGRGIPVEKHRQSGKSTLTTVLTTTHAGGKFDGAQGASIGVHGVGSTATIALSKYSKAVVYRGGWYYQEFECGEPITKDPISSKSSGLPEYMDPKVKKGTCIFFKPDRSIIQKDARIDISYLREYIRLLACCHPKLTIRLIWDGKEKSYSFPNGLLSWIKSDLKKNDTTPIGEFPPLTINTPAVQMAIQWVEDADSTLVSSVSGARTLRGGTHVNALGNIIIETLKPGKKIKLDSDKVLSGTVGVLNVNVVAPSFSGQTKERLASPGAKELVEKAVRKEVASYFRKHKELKDYILQRAASLAKIEEDAKAARKLVSSVKKSKTGLSLPAKLAACPSARPEQRELFIVEGDSAGGSVLAGRFPKYQEVLPLRGKLLNVAKADMRKATESQEIINILQSVGFTKDGFTPRVGKVVVATDSDSDGAHIRTLVLTVLAKFCPELFENGSVFVSDVPLYSYRDGKTFVHAATLEELRKKIGSKFDRRKMTRAKGLGEVSGDELRFSLMDPETRFIRQVSANEGKAAAKEFWNLVGDDVQSRRNLLGI